MFFLYQQLRQFMINAAPGGKCLEINANQDQYFITNLSIQSSTKNGYRCTGNVSGWTACTYLTQSPKRKAWSIPTELKKESEFL